MRRRILLADDSVTIQKVIELTFMDEDYEVRAVSNGDEAIQALPETDPDVVIADVHMPGANGYEVCRRSKARKPEVPVLLLVGTFEPFDEAQARSAGADSFLKKPFDSQELLQRVGDLLASSRPAAAAPAPSPSVGAETVRLSALSSMPALSFEPEPAPPPVPQPIDDWRGFELSPEPEPELSSPFSAESSFALEEPSLPDGEPMFELEAEPDSAPAPSYSPGGDVFGFEPQPIAAAPAFEASPFVNDQITDFTDTERLGVPETAAPLVGSLEETEQRIEAPAPMSLGQSHEPQAEARMAVPDAAAPPARLPLGRAEVADGGLSDADVDRIARRVVELLGDRTVRDVAWEVIPDLAEVVIRDRLRELEGQLESLE
jgi:CheY-like chemotaxis protein